MTTSSSRASFAKCSDRLVAFERARPVEELLALVSAEVGPLEELGREDDLGTSSCGFADVPVDARHVVRSRCPRAGTGWPRR